MKKLLPIFFVLLSMEACKPRSDGPQQTKIIVQTPLEAKADQAEAFSVFSCDDVSRFHLATAKKTFSLSSDEKLAVDDASLTGAILTFTASVDFEMAKIQICDVDGSVCDLFYAFQSPAELVFREVGFYKISVQLFDDMSVGKWSEPIRIRNDIEFDRESIDRALQRRNGLEQALKGASEMWELGINGMTYIQFMRAYNYVYVEGNGLNLSDSLRNPCQPSHETASTVDHQDTPQPPEAIPATNPPSSQENNADPSENANHDNKKGGTDNSSKKEDSGELEKFVKDNFKIGALVAGFASYGLVFVMAGKALSKIKENKQYVKEVLDTHDLIQRIKNQYVGEVSTGNNKNIIKALDDLQVKNPKIYADADAEGLLANLRKGQSEIDFRQARIDDIKLSLKKRNLAQNEKTGLWQERARLQSEISGAKNMSRAVVDNPAQTRINEMKKNIGSVETKATVGKIGGVAFLGASFIVTGLLALTDDERIFLEQTKEAQKRMHEGLLWELLHR